MNKRHSSRIVAGYKAEISYGNKCYIGVIENLSDTGANILTDLIDNSIDFRPGDTIELKIETPAGGPLKLLCEIKWADKIPPHNVRSRIGLEITDPPWDKNNFFL